MSLSVYGATGYIGRTFCNIFPEKSRPIDRGQRTPMDRDILYFISTTHNYHVFKEITEDVKSNLLVLTEVLDRVVEVKDRRFDNHEDITFNFISCWFVYGDANTNPVSEDGLCDPRGFYSITKRAAEQLIISFCETFGVKYRILRLCNVLGDNDRDASLQKNAITQMIANMRDGQPIRLYNEGTDIRDILHVQDVCRAIDLVITKGEKNQIYNIGSGQPTKVGDIINKAKELLNSSSEIVSVPSPKFHSVVQTKDFWMDTTKLKSLGFEQKISLDDLIKQLCKI